MAKFEVMGIQEVDYLSKKTNQQVTGTTLHVLGNSPHVTGQTCETLFISSRLNIPGIDLVTPGCTIDVQYNRYGSIDSLEILD